MAEHTEFLAQTKFNYNNTVYAFFWSCIVDVEYNCWSQRMLLKRVYRLKTIHNMFGTLYTRVLNCKKKKNR